MHAGRVYDIMSAIILLGCDTLADGLTESGLGFLHKKCVRIKHGTLSRIQFAPEYIDALKDAVNSGIILDDDRVFQILRDTYLKLYNGNVYNSIERRVLCGVSKDLFGDPHAWEVGLTKLEIKKKITQPVELPDGYQDLHWVLQEIEPFHRGTRRVICETSDILEAIRAERTQGLQTVYYAFCKTFFPMIRSGIKRENVGRYNKFRCAARDFSKALYDGDQDHWRIDYAEFYNLDPAE